MTLSDFDQALRHKYRIEPNGSFVPGVTTVIGILEKPALVWAASGIAAKTAVEESRRKRTIVTRHRKRLSSLGKKERELGYHGTDNEVFIHYCRGEHKRQWDAKAARGTRMHEVAEKWSLDPTGPVKISVDDLKFVEALEKFHLLYRPRFHLVECIVTNPEYRYGGRFDNVVELDGPGAQGLFLGDYKTGGKYPYDVALQAEGYMNCELAQFNTDGSLAPSTSLPQLDGARTIYLGEDGNVTVLDPFAVISRDDAWTAFRSCLNLYNINQTINAALKENA
jgi:hypothetical protein